MRTWIAGLLLASALAVMAPPAGAQSGDAEWKGPLDLGFELGIGAQGFRLGGRLTGPGGVYRFGFGGRPRRDGFTFEGWVDDKGVTRGFTLDAEITPWSRDAGATPSSHARPESL
jgi:hypothetical protein